MPGARGHLKTYVENPVTYDFYPTEEVPVKMAASWNIPPLPIAKGSCVGKVKVIDELGMVLQEVPLLALEDLKPTSWHRLSLFFTHNQRGRKLAFGGGAVLVILFLFSIRKKRSSRVYR